LLVVVVGAVAGGGAGSGALARATPASMPRATRWPLIVFQAFSKRTRDANAA